MGKGKFALALVAAGSVAFFLRKRRRHRERIDLYYDDGSMVSLEPGTLEAGRRADMVLVRLSRLDQPYLNPDVSILDALVHRARGVDVDATIVDGEVVMREGRVTRVDKDALYKEIRANLNRPQTDGELALEELALEVRPHLKAYYAGSVSEELRPHSVYNAR